MNLFQRLAFVFNPSKKSTGLVTFEATARTSERNFEAFADEGYSKNVVVRRSVDIIARSVADMPLVLFERKRDGDKKEITNHPVLDLLRAPNVKQSYFQFAESAVGYLCISGNNFMLKVEGAIRRQRPVSELWNLHPGSFKIKPGKAMGMPSAYIFETSRGPVPYEVDEATGKSAITHIPLFNPNDRFWGLSPLEASLIQVDQHTASDIWNLSLLQNSARPSGAFVVEKDVTLNSDQRENLRRGLNESYTQAKNAGKMMLLEGGVSYEEMGLSPKDMDFVNTKKVSKGDIALAYGVPGQLVGIEDQQKFDNFAQAKLWLYENTVLPAGNLFLSYLNRDVVSLFGENLQVEFDLDRVAALQPLRDAKFEKIKQADWLTPNEKREATDYSPYEPGADNPAERIYIGSGMIPIEDASFSLDDETETDDEDFRDQEADDELEVDEDGKSFKQSVFNNRNETQRQRLWFAQQRKRNRFAQVFATQVAAVFMREAKKIAKSFDGVPNELLEFVALDAIASGKRDMSLVYSKNLQDIMQHFGRQVLDVPKSVSHKVETKQSNTRFEDFINRYIEAETARKIVNISAVTQKRVVKVIKEGIAEGENIDEITTRVEAVYSSFTKSRSLTIARTEVHNAAEAGKLAAAKSLQLPMMKQWVHSTKGPDRDRAHHKAINGQTVGLEEKFEVPSDDGVDLMENPGDRDAPADQVINCTCTTVFVTQDV